MCSCVQQWARPSRRGLTCGLEAQLPLCSQGDVRTPITPACRDSRSRIDQQQHRDLVTSALHSHASWPAQSARISGQSVSFEEPSIVIAKRYPSNSGARGTDPRGGVSTAACNVDSCPCPHAAVALRMSSARCSHSSRVPYCRKWTPFLSLGCGLLSALSLVFGAEMRA